MDHRHRNSGGQRPDHNRHVLLLPAVDHGILVGIAVTKLRDSVKGRLRRNIFCDTKIGESKAPPVNNMLTRVAPLQATQLRTISMEALFIGQTYIDVTFVVDRIPTGDEKVVADDYAVSFGGNAVSAAFCCAKLGIVPELMTSLADDWLARMFLDMAAKYQISVHGRKVKESSLSFVMPNHGMRAIIRCRDDNYLHPVPPLDLTGCRALHLDGHQADAAIHYAKLCREKGILTSLDGGGLRSNTLELLEHIDV